MRVILLAAYNALRLLTWPFRAIWWALRRRRSPRWVALNLRGRIEELPRFQGRLSRLWTGLRPQRRSMAEIRRLCDRLAADPRIEGLFLRLEHLDGGYPTLSSLRVEIARLRARGKRVVCYLPLGAQQRELFIAAAADRVLAMPHAGFSALGPAAARTYVAPLLERMGVRVVATAEGRYKTAAEPLVSDTMSAPEHEQLEAIVRTLYHEWTQALASRPALAESGAERLFQVGLFGGERARELGAIDACAYEDELANELALQKGEQPQLHERYLQGPDAVPPRVLAPMRRNKIALVRLAGAIGERSTRGIDLHGTTALLQRLAKADRVAGVLLYVDSPGGSALVSELLHREVARLAARKPVVTWMGNVAASGGYYLASATPVIVAQPTTLTGSIGVVSLRPITERLLESLRVRREIVSLTPYADLYSWARAPNPAEELLLKAETMRFYDRFLDIVAEGRKRPRAEIAKLAEGRVWSGQDAHAHGLVDVLGGYHEARAQLDLLLGERAERVDPEPVLVHPPRRPTAPVVPAAAAGALGAIARVATASLDGAPWAEIAALALSGERTFAYALDLPELA